LEVAAHAACPVVVVLRDNALPEAALERVVVGVDGESAIERRGRLRLRLRVDPRPGPDRAAHPVDALVDASKISDLLVIGGRRRGRIGSALLGAVGHGVLHDAHCPVAVVHPRTRS
jgi:hypothetical protein